MTTQKIFYRSAVPVSATAHRGLSVKAGNSYSFAEKANSVPLAAAEFAPAAADYPIVFAGGDGNVFPAAVLGTQNDENLFIGANGDWQGQYIPAYIRRYPFIFSVAEDQTTFTLLIDEDFEGVNREGRGEQLFDVDGNQTHYLQNVLRFLEGYQASFLRTQAFCRRLVELDLLVPMQARFNIGPGVQRSLGGFTVLDRERLKALDAETLADLVVRDEMECIFLHLASLRHFRDLPGMMPKDGLDAGADDAPGDVTAH